MDAAGATRSRRSRPPAGRQPGLALATSTPGAPDGLDAVLRDYLAATDRLQHTHEALQAEIRRLRDELASKDRELELRRRLAALGEIAAGVAHEVRNPLGAIQLYSCLLRKECSRNEFDAGLRLLDKIEAGVRAIDGIVQDTLALAPARSVPTACALGPVLQRAAETAEPVLGRHAVALQIEPIPAGLWVVANADGLQRVLVNLLTNAAEASPRGAAVEVSLAEDEQELTLDVADRGCGLPDADSHRVFDPFYTTKEHGTGLGLTIAHRLVAAYGGRLYGRPRDGGGTVFTLVLPRATAGQAQDVEAEAHAPYSAA